MYRIDLENIGNVTIYKPASGFFNDSMSLRECPEDSDCPDLEYDNNNEIEYIEDFNSLNNIIDTDGLKIFPGYTAKYEALLTVNQAMIDYGGVKNILDVTYVDILGQSKNIKSIDNDEFDNEDETEDYTEFIIDVSPDLEITKYLMVEAEDNTPIEIDVTVQGGAFKYSILDGDGVEQDVTSTLTLERGKTYRFNQDDPSNLGNQIYFSLEEDGNSYQYGVGSLDGSGEYTGLPSGTAGNNFAHTLLTVDPINQSGLISHAPISAIYTASTTQNGMGKLINIKQPEIDVSLDDELTYYIKVENTGNAILDVPNPPVDTITSNGTPLSLDDGYPLFLRKFATTSNTSQTRLIPGDILVWEAKYTVEQTAINGGDITNSATIEAQTLIGDTINKTSNDGDNTDGDNNDDTIIEITPLPSIEVKKTWDHDDIFENGRVDRGETVTFYIEIINTGNVTVDNFTFEEDFFDLREVQPRDLSGDLTPITTDQDETLIPGQSIVYTTTYLVDQITVDKGGLTNSVVVTAEGAGILVSDVSDDDDPTAGDNNGSDPTIITIDDFSGLTVTKTIKNRKLKIMLLGKLSHMLLK